MGAAKREAAEIRRLEERLKDELPAAGTAVAAMPGGGVKKFAKLPLSRYTLDG